MPHQNRVTPYGDLVAYPERGTLMGNRGILHDEHGKLTRRRWTTHAWITCLLEFKGRQRVVMSPGTYTELFFLDEVTAFAAGHRPCGECRRAEYQHFKSCWQTGNAQPHSRLADIDHQLHQERVNRAGQKVLWQANINTLPEGTMLHLDGEAYLLWAAALYRWSPAGYAVPLSKPQNTQVTVLTPPSIVKTFQAGYIPQIHESIHTPRQPNDDTTL